MTLIRRPAEIDWFRIFADLRKQGYGSERIADALGVPGSTVRYWIDKVDCVPNFEDGRAIVILYEQVCRGAPPTKDWKLT